MSSRAPSEQTPLLSEVASSAATSLEDADGPPATTPLPKGQVALLTFTRLADPLAFAILFPFINSMVLRTGQIAVEEVGYYVGAIESLFALVQMIFLMPWGWASDRYGRKPVLLVSLLGTVLSTILFGFSTHLWQMFAARAISGLFGGNAVVVRTLFAEMSDSTNQARAFGFFAFASNIGLMLGPLIGGTFAEPETQFPRTFGRIPLLRKYPYALPCIITGAYALLAFALNVIFLREPGRRENEGVPKEQRKPSVRAVLTPPVLKALLVFSATTILGIAYMALLPLWLFTPVDLGGLSFSPSGISVIFASIGFSQSVWLLVVMPPLERSLGTYRLLRSCFTYWPLGFLMPILANQFAKRNNSAGVYLITSVMSTLGVGTAMAFTCLQLIINNVSPRAHLGTINGIALTVNSAWRTVGPTAITSTFAFSVEHNVLGRYLAWTILAIWAVVVYFLSALAPKQDVRMADVVAPPTTDEEAAGTTGTVTTQDDQQ
ncbi:MFS general substrate transporter [Punctularia strigosozonata HHB-11173 SS5]|uniref:MFS general substrate transporter n=1 Tax=Punctularia strigosozonata (strain HHB-11173) TaxID=741275 RepID=UPI00044182EB|nr:MFS general substrate transporter [Punctularia strigosozonata HHB-11173 SS5]EIN12346.1 MFS general substrate transporter [Punctularia strigosozonata HHB-11173 SS5]